MSAVKQTQISVYMKSCGVIKSQNGLDIIQFYPESNFL